MFANKVEILLLVNNYRHLYSEPMMIHINMSRFQTASLTIAIVSGNDFRRNRVFAITHMLCQCSLLSKEPVLNGFRIDLKFRYRCVNAPLRKLKNTNDHVVCCTSVLFRSLLWFYTLVL